MQTNAPFGLRPVYHPSGTIRQRQLANGLSAAYANNIFSGQPVKMLGTGYISEVTGTSDEFVGVFCGVSYTPVGGRPVVSNYWPGGTAFVAGSLTVFFTDDPWIEYEIQADGSVAQSAIGGGADFSNLTAGNTSTGRSQCTMSSTIAGSGTKQLRIVDLAPYEENAWGDSYTVVRVLIALHQYTGNKAVI